MHQNECSKFDVCLILGRGSSSPSQDYHCSSLNSSHSWLLSVQSVSGSLSVQNISHVIQVCTLYIANPVHQMPHDSAMCVWLLPIEYKCRVVDSCAADWKIRLEVWRKNSERRTATSPPWITPWSSPRKGCVNWNAPSRLKSQQVDTPTFRHSSLP